MPEPVEHDLAVPLPAGEGTEQLGRTVQGIRWRGPGGGRTATAQRCALRGPVPPDLNAVLPKPRRLAADRKRARRPRTGTSRRGAGWGSPRTMSSGWQAIDCVSQDRLQTQPARGSAAWRLWARVVRAVQEDHRGVDLRSRFSPAG